MAHPLLDGWQIHVQIVEQVRDEKSAEAVERLYARRIADHFFVVQKIQVAAESQAQISGAIECQISGAVIEQEFFSGCGGMFHAEVIAERRHQRHYLISPFFDGVALVGEPIAAANGVIYVLGEVNE